MSERSIEVRRAELAALIEGRSDEEITRGVEERGVEGVLDDVFQGMAEAFLPDKATGQSAVVQYDVTVAGKPHTYQLKIAGGKCEIVKGRAAAPRVTLTLALPDFLRLVAGKLPPVQVLHDRQAQAAGRHDDRHRDAGLVPAGLRRVRANSSAAWRFARQARGANGARRVAPPPRGGRA